MGRVFFNTRKDITAIDGNHTVLASESGKTFMMSATGCTVAMTLPTTLEKGLNYKFVVEEDTPANIITIAAGSAIVDLVMKDAGGNASNSTAGTAVSNILIGTSSTQGDYVNMFTDGTTWYAEAMSGIDNAITTS